MPLVSLPAAIFRDGNMRYTLRNKEAVCPAAVFRHGADWLVVLQRWARTSNLLTHRGTGYQRI